MHDDLDGRDGKPREPLDLVANLGPDGSGDLCEVQTVLHDHAEANS